MSAECLPIEVLVGLFHYLGVSDLLSVSQVSRLWREAASYLLADRVTIMITDDVNPAVDTFLASSIPYHNWVFKEVDMCCIVALKKLWRRQGGNFLSLGLYNITLSEEDFVTLLSYCCRLRFLSIGSRHLFRSGRLR
ncbi:uncharacterized protein LOC119582564 [Penaeus monodon]|uniref:uncharacterized protein LOC119582564 n=1 Tax=Penaeus monodon TaxID=6687 RepID=UPI0018A6FA06|nr:uncharacterized protein LOC119582564 [Penaeus monodon]